MKTIYEIAYNDPFNERIEPIGFFETKEEAIRVIEETPLALLEYVPEAIDPVTVWVREIQIGRIFTYIDRFATVFETEITRT